MILFISLSLRRALITSWCNPSLAGSTTATIGHPGSIPLISFLMASSALEAINFVVPSVPENPFFSAFVHALAIAGDEISIPTTLPTAPSFKHVKPMVPVPQQTSNKTVFCGSVVTSFSFSTTTE